VCASLCVYCGVCASLCVYCGVCASSCVWVDVAEYIVLHPVDPNINGGVMERIAGHEMHKLVLNTHTHTHTCTRIHTYTHTHACAHTHTHTRAHTHTHTRAHTNTQDLSWAKPAIKWEGILHELWKGIPNNTKSSIVTPVEEPLPGECVCALYVFVCVMCVCF